MVSNNVLVALKYQRLLLNVIWQKFYTIKRLHKAKNCKIIVQKQTNRIITAELKFGKIFLKLWKLASNFITKLYIQYARNNYEIFENFGTMLEYLDQFLRPSTKLQTLAIKFGNETKVCVFGRKKTCLDVKRPKTFILVHIPNTTSIQVEKS